MASQPNETASQDLAHVIQYAQLAAVLLCDRRAEFSKGKRRITLTIDDENNLLDFLKGIEERAGAILNKIAVVLETRAHDGATLVRRWIEPSFAALDETWHDKLADQSMWDYERYGSTETFILLPCGEIPVRALQREATT